MRRRRERRVHERRRGTSRRQNHGYPRTPRMLDAHQLPALPDEGVTQMRTSLVHPPAVLATASSRGRRSGRCSAFHERIELRERRLCKERLQRSCAHAPSNAHIMRVFGVNMSSQVKSSQVKTSHTCSPSSLLRASVCSVPSIADRSFGKTWLSKKVRSEHFFGDTVHEMLVKTNFPIVETRLVERLFSNRA